VSLSFVCSFIASTQRTRDEDNFEVDLFCSSLSHVSPHTHDTAMASERPGFRPNRARASLSAVPSASTSTSLFPNKENGNSTSTLSTSTTAQANPIRKKRAQSLGGDALEALRKRTKVETLRQEATMNFELSPTKQERRKAVSTFSYIRRVLKQSLASFETGSSSFHPENSWSSFRKQHSQLRFSTSSVPRSYLQYHRPLERFHLPAETEPPKVFD